MITEVAWIEEKEIAKVYEDGKLLVSIPYEKHWPPCGECIIGREWCTKTILGSKDENCTFKNLVCEKTPGSFRPFVTRNILGRYFKGKLIKKQGHENLLSNHTPERKAEGDGKRASDSTEQGS